MTSDRQLFVEVTGINVAGSTLWQASSTITKGRDSGGRPSGASTRGREVPDDDALDLLFCWLPFDSSSSLVMMPHAAKSLGSAAPVDVETTTSASRRALVAAILQA
jgi:hypothetical protein